MSKQRPSDVLQVRPLAHWKRRLFRNTYTRQGRRFTLQRWSIKIQHDGRRHTFTLNARARSPAAVEARAIYATLRANGWDAVRRKPEAPRADAPHGSQRLLVGRYGFPAGASPGRSFAVRIDHGGIGHFFPLGTDNANAAAVAAQEIHQAVTDHGWASARRRFPLELTMALEWFSNPILWTYTTIHTIPEGRPLPVATHSKKNSPPALIVETDPKICRAIAWCVSQAGFRAVSCGNAAACRRALAKRQPRFVLVNRLLAETVGSFVPGQIAPLPSGAPVLTYSIYPNSDELFLKTPGGASGYFLKRTEAGKILEPFAEAAAESRLTADELFQRVQDYFKKLLRPTSARNTLGLARLTRREREVLALLSKGYIDKEIAPALGISAWTVRGHIKKIFERLNVHTRTGAVVQYLEK